MKKEKTVLAVISAPVFLVYCYSRKAFDTESGMTPTPSKHNTYSSLSESDW